MADLFYSEFDSDTWVGSSNNEGKEIKSLGLWFELNSKFAILNSSHEPRR
jgi:hypothetical protein